MQLLFLQNGRHSTIKELSGKIDKIFEREAFFVLYPATIDIDGSRAGEGVDDILTFGRFS